MVGHDRLERTVASPHDRGPVLPGLNLRHAPNLFEHSTRLLDASIGITRGNSITVLIGKPSPNGSEQFLQVLPSLGKHPKKLIEKIVVDLWEERVGLLGESVHDFRLSDARPLARRFHQFVPFELRQLGPDGIIREVKGIGKVAHRPILTPQEMGDAAARVREETFNPAIIHSEATD
jgi:hypothetical protein